MTGAGTVSDAMHPGVVSCRPETTLAEVAGLMAEHAVHCVVVDGIMRDAAGGDRLVWAVASDLDVARAVSAGPGRTPSPPERWPGRTPSASRPRTPSATRPGSWPATG